MAGYLTETPIDPAGLLAAVAAPGCGGTAYFTGTVRRSSADGDVTGIEYSSYPEMVEAEFGRIEAEVRARWPEARLAIRHRLGWIPVGEASIAIAAACPHRAEAFDACRYVIEQTKVRVPVWKREHLADGTTRWVEPRASDMPAPGAARG